MKLGHDPIAIKPSQAQPNGSCSAWHSGPEVRPGHSPVQASGRHDPLSFVPCWANFIVLWASPFSLTQMARYSHDEPCIEEEQVGVSASRYHM
jgi:hypothetical protein